ncbi:MAG: hypothetical protein FJ109_05465 [Deltaproteobacteria bacterium]|nr:hypothetical protein [Deltaproteobacteria bacterium]
MKRLLLAILAATVLWPSAVLGQPEDSACDELRSHGDVSDIDLLRCRFEGLRCMRVEREGRASSPDETSLPPATWQATEESVYVTCGGLGCIDAPDSEDPSMGVCGTPSIPDDCGGAAIVGGLCGEQHLIMKKLPGIVPTRLFFTAHPIVDSGFDGAAGFNPDVAAGVLLQVGLGRSQSRELAGGGVLHYGFPNCYLHAEALWSRFRVGHDVGVGYKTGSSWVSRVALTGFGQYAGETGLEDDNATYRFGPAVQVEIYFNVILKGGWLPVGTGEGPVWFAGLTYGASLLDDFRK